ncbi:MarR family winged helix-turn-helix transcriptional regulator [Catenuloplanes atrovinosus]|uniref:DNA-binding MarR family transcriptional regulator n=1 Tax=Catenuloplanes atrovinosus TaxID=137266 RepID=A0AAE3YW92_9ACTN|nr:MarR family transcriptional regulator [Catenuloplanes atrovinosus]MDR7281033.1 DNA-binding MarR family transcriptional regulator [Catenuloplanes atrovinosus]
MADEDKDRLIAKIMETQRRLQYLFAHDRSNPLFDAHLTMPQLKILLMLGAGGGASGQELQRFMGVSLATVTGIVDRLVAHDLVERHEDPHDRRVRRVVLTAHGRQTVERIIMAGTDRQARVLRRMSAPELEVIVRATELLVTAVEADVAEERAEPVAENLH